jgi:hypothetical protein
MIKFVYGILPAIVSYKEVEEEVKNYTSGIHIVIEPKYKCDEGMLHHELTHVKQWYKNIFGRKSYNKDREYRLNCEIEAYVNQTKYPKCDGTFLTLEEVSLKLTWDRYNLGLTQEQAMAEIMAWLDKE